MAFLIRNESDGFECDARTLYSWVFSRKKQKEHKKISRQFSLVQSKTFDGIAFAGLIHIRKMSLTLEIKHIVFILCARRVRLEL